MILIHELAHAERFDSRFGAAASLAQTLWFFLPFIGWLHDQLRIDQEFVADQRAARKTGSSAGYAQRLVGLAASREPLSGSEPLPLGPTSLEGWSLTRRSQNPLLQRVVMLLHSPIAVELESPRWWSLVASVLVVGLAIFSSSLSLMLCDRPSNGLLPVKNPSPVPNRFHIAQFLASPTQVTS